MKVPPLLPRFVVMPDGERFVPLEQVIAAHLDALFPGMDGGRPLTFRVTRNADLTLEEEEADDLLAAVEMELRRRRFGRAVRLEVEAGASRRGARAARCASSTSTDDDVYAPPGPLDLAGLWALHAPRPARAQGRAVAAGHPDPARRRAEDERTTSSRSSASGDVLVHHPYDSFAHLGRGVHPPGGRRPAGAAIKLTLYRTSGRQPDRAQA